MNEPFSIPAAARTPSFVQVVFEKQQDRWLHRIQWVNCDETLIVANSIEGTSHENWPASPTFQEITQQELKGGVLLLGVGMAGRSHWSLSCSSQTGDDPLQTSILMDIACLTKDLPAGWLGSSYQIHPQWAVKTHDQRRLTLVHGEVEIEIVAREGERCDSESTMVDDQFQVRPTRISNSPDIPTRWAFIVDVRNNGA